MRVTLTVAAVLVIAVLVLIPLVNVFAQALSEGVGRYWDNLFSDRDTLAAIKLTLVVAPTALMLNLVFGVVAAWAIAKFSFPGRTFLTALIDLPFSVSPVVAGLIFVLIFGLQGYLGPFLRRDGYSAMPYLLSMLGRRRSMCCCTSDCDRSIRWNAAAGGTTPGSPPCSAARWCSS